MNEQELQQILNSDMKLWDRAETKEDGGAIIKSLDLPYNIGRVEIRLEGAANDAIKRRSALGSFGEYIRGLIEDAIGDEAITIRAQQKATMASKDTSRVVDGEGDDQARHGWEDEGGATSLPNQEAVPSHDAPTIRAEDMDRRAKWVRGSIGELTQNLDSLKRELEWLEGSLEVYRIIDDSSAHKKTSQSD